MEDDREFRGFIEGVSVTTQELAAIVSMPEFSIREVKQYLQDGKDSSPPKNQSSLRRAVPGAGSRTMQGDARPAQGAHAGRQL